MVALLHGRQLYVANIGDSRCVLSRSGRAVDMSDDHKPEDEPELQRIVKAGGKVTMDGRVNGGLNLSRAFGEWRRGGGGGVVCLRGGGSQQLGIFCESRGREGRGTRSSGCSCVIQL